MSDLSLLVIAQMLNCIREKSDANNQALALVVVTLRKAKDLSY